MIPLYRAYIVAKWFFRLIVYTTLKILRKLTNPFEVDIGSKRKIDMVRNERISGRKLANNLFLS